TPPEAPLAPLSKIRQRVEAPSLTFEEQAAVLLELREIMRLHQENAADIRQLLMELRNRNDLLARMEPEIGKMQQEIAELIAIQNRARSALPRMRLLAIVALLVVIVSALIVLPQLSKIIGNPPTLTLTSTLNALGPTPTQFVLSTNPPAQTT